MAVRSLLWHGKNSTKQQQQVGLTIIEIALALFLAALLLASYFSLKRQRQQVSALNGCAQKQWRWMNALDEIESRAHRWEMAANACLQAGFSPFVRQEGSGQIEGMHQLLGSRPLVETMQEPRRLLVATPHNFEVNQAVLFCEAGNYLWGTVQEVHNAPQPGQSVLVVDYPNAEFGKVWHQGALLVATQPVKYEVVHDMETNELFESVVGKNNKSMARLFTDFNMSVNETDAMIEAQLALAEADCRVDSKVVISKRPMPVWDGDWYLRDGNLVLVP